MKQENLERLKLLRRFADDARTWWATYRKAISTPSCDKYEARFNGDARFIVFRLKNLSFCALTGYYGSSSCSTFGHLNNDLANKYLPAAMDALASQLFEKMAELAEADAKKITDAAQAELTELNRMVV